MYLSDNGCVDSKGEFHEPWSQWYTDNIYRCWVFPTKELDFGRIYLSFIATLRTIRFWLKLIQQNNRPNRYKKLAFPDARMSTHEVTPTCSSWYKYLYDTFNKLGMYNIWDVQSIPNRKTVCLSVKIRLFDIFKCDIKILHVKVYTDPFTSCAVAQYVQYFWLL